MKKAPILLLTILIVYALTGCKEYTRNQIIGDYKCNTRYTSNFNGRIVQGIGIAAAAILLFIPFTIPYILKKEALSDRIRIDNVEFYPLIRDSRNSM
ncbi:MAG: hypothetical protein U0T32_01265 [Chitinophagales bacterium]